MEPITWKEWIALIATVISTIWGTSVGRNVIETALRKVLPDRIEDKVLGFILEVEESMSGQPGAVKKTIVLEKMTAWLDRFAPALPWYVKVLPWKTVALKIIAKTIDAAVAAWNKPKLATEFLIVKTTGEGAKKAR